MILFQYLNSMLFVIVYARKDHFKATEIAKFQDLRLCYVVYHKLDFGIGIFVYFINQTIPHHIYIYIQL